MAQKKLTDCPENLREAIDWLIQIRHGGDKKGLENLARALKKFFEVGINKTVESLTERENQLKCPANPYENSSYCSLKNDLMKQTEQRIKALATEINNGSSADKKSLNDLESKLSELKSEEQKHYDEFHSLSDDSRMKALEDIKKRQSTLKNLQSKLEAFIGKKEDVKTSNDILDKLCDGLETFLGFNSTSKGYTGQGIVYSDLDRLCDAVMGFLHGVLESVKTEDSVTTYDTNSPNIDDVITTLNDKIGHGHIGLVKSVTQVKKWLDGCHRYVESLTMRVITDLSKIVSDITVEHIPKFNSLTNDNLQSMRIKFISSVNGLEQKMSALKNSYEGYNALDKNLKGILEPSLNKIDEGIKMLQFSLDDSAVMQKVDEQLEAEKRRLHTAVMTQTANLRETLHNELYKIRDRINSLNKIKWTQFQNITQTINAAQRFLDERFDANYEHEITKHFDMLQQEIKEFYNDLATKKTALERLVSSAQEHFMILNDKAGADATKEGLLKDWLAVQTTIIDLVNGQIIAHGKTDGLNGIVTGVENYAKGFGNGQFDSKIRMWVEDGLKDTVVSDYIEKCVEVSTGGLLHGTGKIIRDAIRDKLTGVIQQTVKRIATSSGLDNSIEIKNVATKFQAFAGAIERDIAASLATETAVSTVEEYDKLQSMSPPSYNRTYLKLAVNAIIRSVGNNLKQISSELQRFALLSKLHTNMTAAIEKVNTIATTLDGHDEKSSLGKKISQSLSTVKNKIDNLGEILKDSNAKLPKAVKTLETELIAAVYDLSIKDECSIDVKRKSAATKMKELKRGVQFKIHDILEMTNNANTYLKMAIDNVLIAYKGAYNIAIEGIIRLRDELVAAVGAAFSIITEDMRKLFAENRKTDLAALRSLIEKQITIIRNTFNNDLNSGVKGLIKIMLNNNGTLEASATIVTPSNSQTPVTVEHFKNVAAMSKRYFDKILIYIWNDLEALIDSQFSTMHVYKTKVDAIKTDLNEVFNHLIEPKDKVYNYDNVFFNLFDKLKNLLTDLSSHDFRASAYPVLGALKKGMKGFTQQLGRAYINKYEGSNAIEWEDASKKDSKDNLSEDAMHCAKIFLTCIPEWNWHLPYLRTECNGGSKHSKIFLTGVKKQKNLFGHWFGERGFTVSVDENTQSGELDRNCTGSKIGGLLNHEIKGLNKDLYAVMQTHGLSTKGSTILTQIFSLCYDRLHTYRQICHIQYHPTAKAPTTVNQMLHWLTGLYYTPMYEALRSHLETVFKEFLKEHKVEKETLPVAVPERTGAKIIQEFNIGNLLGSFQNVTIRPADILLTILGHGDADGRYACEFYTNPYGLDYPTDVNKCFDLLVEVCLRLNHQLRFLYSQCHNGISSAGWGECWYGKSVGGSRWNCNTMQCPDKTCDRNSDNHLTCGVKSPLQSFLEDGLPGFLPHQFTSPSCTLTCSVRNHRGIPCTTPMGFADISVTASHARTGEHLKNILDKFCGKVPDSLSMLCAYFLCLLRRPPQTLCDMFAFYENFFEHWKGNVEYTDHARVKKHKHDAFYEAVSSANFGVEYKDLDPTILFGSRSHKDHESTHHKGDLFGLVCCKEKDNPVYPCGSYLQPLSLDTRCIFTHKLAADYLSWIVYLTETFYDLLRDLYSKCNKCCTQQVTKCYGRVCAKECTVPQSTTQSVGSASKSLQIKHEELCNSIVKCPSLHPVIYAAGFTFDSARSLSGENGVSKKRSCKDFCDALGLVVQKYNLLYNLVNKHIPDFLWEIRQKFFWTTVALWLLSFLYLIHIMIIRLDLLHIKSHLHSPSSHRIAAQSLLAAVRVGKISKISYLQV